MRDRLRAETAQWHTHVEAITDIENSIRTHDDYIDLLVQLHALHAGFEERLTAPAFGADWRAVGIDIAAHGRASLLAADLKELGREAPLDASGPAPPLVVSTFGHAIGCLYVLEGSALGGRVVAGVVRARIGAVPTTFLSGQGRPHAAAWPAVLAALSRFDTRGGDTAQAVAGACETFAAFAWNLSGLPPRFRSGGRSR